MDDKATLQRFNLRALLLAGMLLGGMPFIMTPLVMRGISAGFPSLFAAVFNGLTVLPASALAFWYRRIACIWLSVNAVILAFGWMRMAPSLQKFDVGGLLGLCGSIALALCLDYVEILGWPAALRNVHKAGHHGGPESN